MTEPAEFIKEGIRDINATHGTEFHIGQGVTYDAGKGRGRRGAMITGAQDGFLKIQRDGDAYEYGALWNPDEIKAES